MSPSTCPLEYWMQGAELIVYPEFCFEDYKIAVSHAGKATHCQTEKDLCKTNNIYTHP